MDDEPYEDETSEPIEVFVRAMTDGSIRLVVTEPPMSIVMTPDQAEAIAAELVGRSYLSRAHTDPEGP